MVELSVRKVGFRECDQSIGRWDQFRADVAPSGRERRYSYEEACTNRTNSSSSLMFRSDTAQYAISDWVQ